MKLSHGHTLRGKERGMDLRVPLESMKGNNAAF